MFGAEVLTPRTLALLVELAGSLYLLGYVGAALLALLRGPPASRLEHARLLIADGVIASLSFKVAATLLKILEVQTWNQIGLFAATLALRTLLKRFFTWERRQLTRGQGMVAAPVPPPPPG
ncbi:DUF1622 domain-containing protein [Deinococcus aestuarii]|uniref:DUF1622 domain-containing protein n=1 Tax=Deinococcus aestuarii TaxID=2774531 RepID=UPI001C0BE52F|nr:DUF1622 domain-containing protein [Deinococcus aestuarii]